MIMFWITFGLLIVLLITSFINYKKNGVPREKFSISRLKRNEFFRTVLVVFLFFGMQEAYDYLIPFNQNHGVEFNQERQKLGLPILPEDWEDISISHKQFIKDWWYKSKNEKSRHLRKTIVYGYFNPKYEHDTFIKRDSAEVTYGASRYSFETKTFDYWIGDFSVSYIDEDGNVENRNPHDFEKVTKQEFDKFLSNSSE